MDVGPAPTKVGMLCRKLGSARLRNHSLFAVQPGQGLSAKVYEPETRRAVRELVWVEIRVIFQNDRILRY